jgi:hypothetical protein
MLQNFLFGVLGSIDEVSKGLFFGNSVNFWVSVTLLLRDVDNENNLNEWSCLRLDKQNE